jgi:hypothetical protein
MKIRDIVVEGFWKNVGAIGKGMAQGIADVVAPGAVDDLSKSFRQANAAKKGQKGASKPGNVLYKGNEYQWLGGQWGLVNPATGKAVPAPKELQKQLNFMSTRKGPADYQKAATGQQTQQQTTSAQQEPLLAQIKLQSSSPLVYQFGKSNMFTLDAQDKWVRYTPGSTKPSPLADVNTQQLLDKAAQRDNIDLARLKPTPTQTKDKITTTDSTKIASVTTPSGVRADKWSDGEWTTPDEEGMDGFVVDSDVPQLEALLKQQQA